MSASESNRPTPRAAASKSFASRPRTHVLLEQGVWALLALTLLGFLGRYFWLFDLCAHFRVYYAVFAALLVAIAWGRGQLRIGVVALAVVAVNASLILPFYRADRAQVSTQAPRLRLLHFNVELDNFARHAEVARYLDGSGADVLLVVETDRRWVEALEAGLSHYTLVISNTDPFRNLYYGTALFLRRGVGPRVSVRKSKVVFLDPTLSHASLAVWLQFAGRPLALLGMHLHPPDGWRLAAIRDEQFREAATWLRSQPSARIMLGDMNATPWSFHYQRLIARTGLANAQQGFGMHPTWLPLHDEWLGLPIDHCLHSPQLAVTRFAQGPSLGSDHRPMLVQLAWSQHGGRPQ